MEELYDKWKEMHAPGDVPKYIVCAWCEMLVQAMTDTPSRMAALDDLLSAMNEATRPSWKAEGKLCST